MAVEYTSSSGCNRVSPTVYVSPLLLAQAYLQLHPPERLWRRQRLLVPVRRPRLCAVLERAGAHCWCPKSPRHLLHEPFLRQPGDVLANPPRRGLLRLQQYNMQFI